MTTYRPCLKLDDSTLQEISNNLSNNPAFREEFISSPQKFLGRRCVEMDSWSVFLPEYNSTSEACTACLCVAAANVSDGGIYTGYYATIGSQVAAYVAVQVKAIVLTILLWEWFSRRVIKVNCELNLSLK